MSSKYSLEISEEAYSKFKKLKKKNKKQLEIIDKKVEQARENPHHFKPLKGEMHGIYRVHIDKSFVLTYEIDEQRKAIRILDYEHHDKAYEKP
ncbi:type II toxin-antitoxin system mRNA interferase toxin, RelE/StbE family [Candidatus Woesearchaeota archaeon]|nr:type II toxin-antitoxin system mRNA interferase toxin, RelE/StbE family [Candidatus Woesearchaeota archaeon]